jgi:LmbE family N-acetylglucosaminyl deacetylase
MATWVSFQAHPDDETTSSAGTLAKAAAAGHRTVLVYATRGEHGEVPDGLLADGEVLWERRVQEARRSAEILGVQRVEFLGYTDSGMMGTPENERAEAFWQADVDEAATRLAALLAEEDADVLSIYDSDGNYGHPDHIQVHRVGVRAAELAGTPRVFEATMNRDHLRRSIQEAVARGEAPPPDDGPDEAFLDTLGRPESMITTTVDVRAHMREKRASMAAHETQIGDIAYFLSMPEESFEVGFGFEWYIRQGVPADHRDDDLFAGLE